MGLICLWNPNTVIHDDPIIQIVEIMCCTWALLWSVGVGSGFGIDVVLGFQFRSISWLLVGLRWCAALVGSDRFSGCQWGQMETTKRGVGDLERLDFCSSYCLSGLVYM